MDRSIEKTQKEVMNKWNAAGGLAVIYRVENILMYYSSDKDPNFKKGQEIDLETAEKSKPYKCLPFDMNNVPNNASMSVTFQWAK